MEYTKEAKAAIARHAQALIEQPDKKYRVVIENDEKDFSFEDFQSRNFSRAYYTAKDFLNTAMRNEPMANWRITSIIERK